MPVEKNLPADDSGFLIEQLRQSLGLLRVAFDSTGEAMLIIDESRVVRWANQQAADLWGRGITVTMVGRPYSDLIRFHRLDGSQLMEMEPSHPLQKALTKDGLNCYQVGTQADDDSNDGKTDLIVRMVSWRQIIQMNQRFILLIFRDQDPLEQALAAQRQFINNLAHELRTPLAILKGNLHRIKRKAQLPDQLQQSLSDATAETNRMGSLVDNLLLLSELDTDLRRWNMQNGELKTFVERWACNLNLEFKKVLRLDSENIAGSSQVQIDQEALCIILDNLLDNSLRFCNVKASIEITFRETFSSVELNFNDNGPGIQSEENHIAVFERFTRIEEHRDLKHTDGAGLGLTLVKSLMEGLGGTAHCHSINDSSNSAQRGFSVTLQFPKI